MERQEPPSDPGGESLQGRRTIEGAERLDAPAPADQVNVTLEAGRVVPGTGVLISPFAETIFTAVYV